ncbi:hypothetical protein SAMN06265360_10314 [Haloechinothrix alba]|uniref:Uncharacterized protein n=1 Tax=Haloechinothrix alba TaxID=664784 RepID=A0A238VM15_9PSEU|nr:hypothetical protein [Haloechinothrix alba]SNR34783.1 hypothetical protein SAMN06265360_10314 [Haloechinothrix alba]
MTNAASTSTLSARARAILEAVVAGRVELSGNSEPDMFVDGLACCDQSLAHDLVRTGLVRRASTTFAGGGHAAVLTYRGLAALSGVQGNQRQRKEV